MPDIKQDFGTTEAHLIHLTIGDTDPLTVTNFRGELPPPTTPKARNALIRAAKSQGLPLVDDALHAVARAVVNPDIAATLIRGDLLTSEAIGPVDISTLSTHLFLTELFPLLQPRAGGYSYDVPSPRVLGMKSEAGTAPMIRVVFQDETHLRSFMRQTIMQTRALGQDYANSILAKRVARPILAHVAEIAFTDGTAPFTVMTVRDGITRVVSSWAAMHPDAGPAELATGIVESLLTKRTSRASETTETVLRARGREALAMDLRARFTAGTADGISEEAIRIGQTFTIPGQVCLNQRQISTSPVASDQQFEDTVQAIIASVHGEFKAWDTSATQAASIQRAIERSVHDDVLDRSVADLALEFQPISNMPVIFEDPRVPTTALWRAVYLIAWMVAPYEFRSIKRHLRDITGASAIRNRAYVSHLATLIDSPWRRVKAHSERQARRAWSNGGPVPTMLMGQDWDPVPTSDFCSLVPKALAGNEDARATLQVAGGVALIADKLLMSNTGSAVESGMVPFRADVDDVVTGLGESEYGLYLLGHAANAFREDAKAVNSFTKTDLTNNPKITEGAYVVPVPSPDNPRLPKRDSTGQLVPLRQYDVVYASNPLKAREAEQGREEERSKRANESETPAEQAAHLRAEAVTFLRDALRRAERLVEVATTDGAIGEPFGTRAEWEKFDSLKRKLDKLLVVNEPTEYHEYEADE